MIWAYLYEMIKSINYQSCSPILVPSKNLTFTTIWLLFGGYLNYIHRTPRSIKHNCMTPNDTSILLLGNMFLLSFHQCSQRDDFSQSNNFSLPITNLGNFEHLSRLIKHNLYVTSVLLLSNMDYCWVSINALSVMIWPGQILSPLSQPLYHGYWGWVARL